METFVPEGTVLGVSGVPAGESDGEAAAHIEMVQVSHRLIYLRRLNTNVCMAFRL